MTVNGVNTKTFYEKMNGEYVGEQQPGKNAGDRFAGNFCRKKKEESENIRKKNENTAGQSTVTQVDYRSSRIASELLLQKSGRVSMQAMAECSVRHITYSESDHVKVCVTEGYTLKAQVDLTAHQVYIEQKNEDGSFLAFEVDPLKLQSADRENPIAVMAMEAWKLAEDILNDGSFTDVSEKLLGQKDMTGQAGRKEETAQPAAAGQTEEKSSDTEKTEEENLKELFEKRLEEFRAMVEDRVKNGPPKIAIGGAEFSEKEWEQLLKKIDAEIDAYKEAVREETEKQQEESEEKMVMEKVRESRGSSFLARMSGEKKAPYSYLADETGCIIYNGVMFVCDDKKQQICLGDVSDSKNVLTIPLAKGGCLKVNRDNLGDLSKAIGMFSPEDVERILRAIAQDNKARQMKQEADEMESEVGLAAEI